MNPYKCTTRALFPDNVTLGLRIILYERCVLYKELVLIIHNSYAKEFGKLLRCHLAPAAAGLRRRCRVHLASEQKDVRRDTVPQLPMIHSYPAHDPFTRDFW